MNPKNKLAKKNLRAVSPRVEALAGEAQDRIRSWIEDIHPLLQKLEPLSPEEQEDFFLILVKREEDQVGLLLEALAGKEEKLDLALSRSLGYWISPRAADLLHRLSASTASKIVAKSIRTSIFRLRSKGLAVEDVGDRSPAIYHPPPPAASEGFLSPIDSLGNRMVWLAKPQILPGMAAFTGAISDTEGIVDFNGLETSRKKFQEYVALFQEEYSGEVVEADPVYCLGLLVEAAEVSERKGKPLPPEFLKWRAAMGPAPALPLRPLIYRHLEEEEVKSRSDLLEHSVSLFQLPFFRSWFLEKEESQKYLSLLAEASASPLVLAPYQKENRLMEIYRQAVHELFTEPRRLLYRRRLEEMAYILWKKGRENEARISLAAALGLEKESGILSPHPFVLELVKRSLQSIREEEDEKKTEDAGLLIRP
jgi:hypothetical protein